MVWYVIKLNPKVAHIYPPMPVKKTVGLLFSPSVQIIFLSLLIDRPRSTQMNGSVPAHTSGRLNGAYGGVDVYEHLASAILLPSLPRGPGAVEHCGSLARTRAVAHQLPRSIDNSGTASEPRRALVVRDLLVQMRHLLGHGHERDKQDAT